MKTKATASIYIDKSYKKNDGTSAISIRVYDGKRRQCFPIEFSMRVDDYEKMIGKKPRRELKDTLLQLNSIEKRATEIINDLPVFTFKGFENRFYENKGASDSIETAFDNYIQQLNKKNRIGNAAAYQTAKKSLLAFCVAKKIKNPTFANVDESFLEDYEKWMEENKKTKTTVGIYLRSLRTLFNIAIEDGLITKQLYPFGKRKYSIPASRNIKKTLSDSVIKLIANYNAAPGSTREKMHDYFMIIYYLGGINVTDLCRLKHRNIQGNTLVYERTKTKDTKGVNNQIRVPISTTAKELINKHASKAINPEAYLFNELTPGLNPVQQRDKVKLVTHLLNDHLKEIAKELKIPAKITSYSARHSAATAYVRHGVPISAVSQILGHTSIKTTQLYVGSIIDENAELIQNAITAFEKAI